MFVVVVVFSWQKHSKQKTSTPVPRKPRTSNKLREVSGSAEDLSGRKDPGEVYDEEQDELDLCKPVLFMFSVKRVPWTQTGYGTITKTLSFQQKKQFKLKVPKKFKHKVSLDNCVLLLLMSDLWMQDAQVLLTSPQSKAMPSEGEGPAGDRLSEAAKVRSTLSKRSILKIFK